MYFALSSFFIITFLTTCLVELSSSQRVAPGVPPQQYDPNVAYQQQQQYGQGHGHPPPPQQHREPYHPQQQQVPQQQFQQHQQQVPVQQQHQQQVPMQQQVPIQQQPGGHGHGQPQQHQQPPHGHGAPPGGHGHGHPPGHGPGQPILDTSNIGQERQHIQEHMSVPIDTSQMSEQELQFHYFKMHDADNNNKLDGCELVKSLIHWHDASNHDPQAGHTIPEAKVFPDEELVNMIDPILENDDKNKDGFIDYAEFVQAQAAAAARSTGKHAA